MFNSNPIPPVQSYFSTISLTVALLVFLTGTVGCDFDSSVKDIKDNVNRMAEDLENHVVEPIESIQEEVKQATGQAGKANITLTGAVATNSCYAPIKPSLGADMPGILEFKTYRSADNEKFPSFYLIAEFSGSADSLAGSTLDATMFVQAETGSHPWASQPDQPVQVKIVSIDAKCIVAELVGGQVINTITKERVQPVGKFEAVRGDAG